MNIRDAVAYTEREIFAEAFDLEPSDLPGAPTEEGLEDNSLELAEGWDGEPLGEEEIAFRNLYGDGDGEILTDRPVQLAYEQEAQNEITQRDQLIEQLTEVNAELEQLADPDRQRRERQQWEDRALNAMTNIDGTLAHIDVQAQRITEQEHARINSSMRAAHEQNGRDFEEAYQSLTSLPKDDPLARQIVQSIVNSPDPGRATMAFHFGNTGASRPPPFMGGRRGLPSGSSTRSARESDWPVSDYGNEDYEDDIFQSAFR